MVISLVWHSGFNLWDTVRELRAYNFSSGMTFTLLLSREINKDKSRWPKTYAMFADFINRAATFD